MKQLPLISVVMAAYNAEKTIAHAIESVLFQTYKNFEFIICDDASTDSTFSTIKEINDARIRIITNEKNMGAGEARDRAISYATGKWIAFIDADDAWHRQRLEILLTESKPGHIIFDNLIECVTSKNRLLGLSKVRSIYCFGKLMLSPTIIELSEFLREPRLIVKPIFERELITKNHIRHSQHKFGEDTYFVLSIIKCGAKLLYVPQPLYFYRLTIGAASTNPKKIELMIDTLNAATKDWILSKSEQSSFNKKIRSLKTQIRYYNLISLAKNKENYNAVIFLLRNPDLLFTAIRRVTFQIWKIIFCKINNAEGR